MDVFAGITESNRRLLAQLHRQTSGLVDVEEAERVLGLDRVKAAKFLAYLAAQGWARRLRRGLYVLIPLEATSPADWREDPWRVAARLFDPGYIAGWSACEHWGLTEQLFRDIAVFTAARIRERKLTVDDTTFVLRRVATNSLFGLQAVWRKGVKAQVSDPTRTLIDICDDPRWGGGVRHVVIVLHAYLASEHRNERLIVDYTRQLGNAAVAKRLGYLWETLAGAGPIPDALRALITPGYALLDPTVLPRGPFVSRWNLRLNVMLPRE